MPAGANSTISSARAISRNFVRGILSFHILSQIGFMALAIGLFTPLSIAACIFYIMHHIIVKTINSDLAIRRPQGGNDLTQRFDRVVQHTAVQAGVQIRGLCLPGKP